MFVCEPCHVLLYKRSGDAVHFSGSYGPCEDCHKTARCHDCRCYLPQTPRPRHDPDMPNPEAKI